MRFKKIKDSYYNAIKIVDDQILHNKDGKRPYILLVDLIYNGKEQTFAVPCRSNIKGNAPVHTYFGLQTRYSTKDGNKHGLHYIKMIPINKKLIENITMHDSLKQTLRYIENHKDKIREEMQDILDDYCNGIHENYCTNLEDIFPIYEECLEKEKAYDKLKINLKAKILKNELLCVNKISDIRPQDYVTIKNGFFKNCQLVNNGMDNHIVLRIYAEDNFKQTKYIDISVFVREIEDKTNLTSLTEKETVKTL